MVPRVQGRLRDPWMSLQAPSWRGLAENLCVRPGRVDGESPHTGIASAFLRGACTSVAAGKSAAAGDDLSRTYTDRTIFYDD